MTRLPGFAQRVVALDVSLRFVRQSQSLRRLYRRRVHRLSVDQAVQQVQNMRLRWRARDVELRFNGVRAQVFADRVPRQPLAPRYLSDREMASVVPASDDAQ